MSRSLAIGLAFLVGAALAVVVILVLLIDIFEKKQEAKKPFFRVVELTDETQDSAVWGKNFPQQYDGYLKTVDMELTRYGGSEAVPRVPDRDDPRNFTARSVLEQMPQLKRMWAGYAFSKDYREKRGHAYMLTDQLYTERQKAGQPGTCIHCHASVYAAYNKLGNGDITAGFEALNRMSYEGAKSHVTHPVTCLDCHAADTMQLRITRPSFAEGIAMAKAVAGHDDFDVNRDATHQEMRSFVCAQCHVEYYFRGEEKRLVYPWAKGLQVDDIYVYYEAEQFADWTHRETQAKMLKAQHPEFELWSQGIHARSGVSCSDCHMPYQRVGAAKVSDHHVRSPLLNINRACQTCHNVAEADLLSRVESIQNRTMKISKIALQALVDLIDDLKTALENGTSEAKLAAARRYQRQASFYVDFVKSENSAGFHAGQEAVRILAEAIDLCRKGQLVLR